MVDYELFVKSLGSNARHYTSEQLHRLHVEVATLARLLDDAQRARTSTSARASKSQHSPQQALDQSVDDRTIEGALIERVDGRDPPQAPKQ